MTTSTTPAASPPLTREARRARWMRRWLIAAALYNLAWGGLVIAFPKLIFELTKIPTPDALGLAIWQCVGMIVGVYGVGYWAASRDPLRHWPIVLVGLLGKIFGPIGFAKALLDGVFPAEFGLTIITNDLIWWIPFTLILWHAWRFHAQPQAVANR